MTILDSINLFAIPSEAEEIRPEIRKFLIEELAGVPENMRARSWGGYDAEFSRKVADKGWIGIALPKEYGGGGRSAFTRYILLEEFLNFGAPVGAHWIAVRNRGTEASPHSGNMQG
jgi:alkylation response protein AidB-like acyl-CoA dehydrogenase